MLSIYIINTKITVLFKLNKFCKGFIKIGFVNITI